MDPVIPPPAGGSALPFAIPPPQCQNPPTDADICGAHDYTMDVTQHRRHHQNDIQDVDYADAIRYEARVVAHTGAAQPDWFQPALEAALAPMMNVLNNIQTRQTGFVRTIAKVQLTLTPLSPGDDALLEIVPFPDGTYPSDVRY